MSKAPLAGPASRPDEVQCRDCKALRASVTAAELASASLPVFSTSPSTASVNEPDIWKAKTGDPNFRTAGKLCSAHSAQLFTHSLVTG